MNDALIFFGSFAVLWLAVVGAVWIKRRPYGLDAFRCGTADACADHVFEDGASFQRGGVWVKNRAASFPFAVLRFDSHYLQIDISAPGFPSRLCLDRSDVEGIKVRRGLLGFGVYFMSAHHRSDAVTFWCLRREPVTSDARRLGWMDDRS